MNEWLVIWWLVILIGVLIIINIGLIINLITKLMNRSK